jgi:4-carboxymuconolactone decarboxylase
MNGPVIGRRFPLLTELERTPERDRVLEELASGGRKVDLSAGLQDVRLGPFEALLLAPELASRSQALGDYVRFHSALPGPIRELVILIAAHRWSSELEWHLHEQIAAREGLAQDVRDALRQGQPAGAEGTAEREVWEFATAVLLTGRVDDAVFGAVAARFGKEGALDLTATLGYYSLIAFVLNVDRYPLPDGVASPFVSPAREPADGGT